MEGLKSNERKGIITFFRSLFVYLLNYSVLLLNKFKALEIEEVNILILKSL